MSASRNLQPVDQQELTTKQRRQTFWVGGLGLIVIIVLIILWWPADPLPPAAPSKPQPGRPTPAENQEPETPTATADIRGLSALSTSINLDVIETDLESTDLDRLQTEFQAIETLLQL